MLANVQFSVNGKQQSVSTDTRRTLLDVLREDLGLTGTTYGCGEGQCRACTVLLDGEPVQSCLTTMDEVEGRKVETIEGLSSGRDLHPVQQAFVEEGAMQCGFCVPGMIMATVGMLRRNREPTQTQIIQSLNGNLCRCCGYGNILRAVQRAARPAQEEAK
ncbi:MAG TPA: (2Fe-2S)-binding protein [Planctomycetota bacterium]|nr:(2Fe-2S)-binding protein [Planctomycetota bacterium]